MLVHVLENLPCPFKCRSAAQSIWRVASQLSLTTAHCITPVPPKGLEFSGIVTALGPQPTQSTDGSSTAPAPLAVGDRVLGVTRFGAYASAINLRRDYVRRVPDSWSLEEAAAYPVQTLTGARRRQGMHLLLGAATQRQRHSGLCLGREQGAPHL